MQTFKIEWFALLAGWYVCNNNIYFKEFVQLYEGISLKDMV